MSKTTVLIIDDDLHMLELLAIHIESAGYSVLKAENGLNALTTIERKIGEIDAIVSDVEMPGIDGYELCAQIREIPSIANIPFIFVSAKTSLDEKLKGYGAGGDEYIAKPVEGEEVVIKLKHIIDNKIVHNKLTTQLKDSQNAAMQAMSYSSHLGQILQFMKESTGLGSYDELAGKLLSTCSDLGLMSAIQFHTKEGILNYRFEGDVTPLEANVIELSRNKGTIFDYESRTIFNHKDFSLLILNMPIDNQEKYGMTKDVLGNLCDAMDTVVRLIASDAAVRQKDGIISEVTKYLDNIDRSYHDVQNANSNAIDDMIHRMEDAMFGFGLSETQEDTVRGIVMYAKNKTAEIFEDGKELYKDFDNIRNVLVKGLK